MPESILSTAEPSARLNSFFYLYRISVSTELTNGGVRRRPVQPAWPSPRHDMPVNMSQSFHLVSQSGPVIKEWHGVASMPHSIRYQNLYHDRLLASSSAFLEASSAAAASAFSLAFFSCNSFMPATAMAIPRLSSLRFWSHQ